MSDFIAEMQILIRKNKQLQAEIAKLKKAYKKYAWHKKDCMLFSIAEHPHCTCGFEQALKGESDAI